MKLFAKYNRINITVSVLAFLAGCVAFYSVMRYVLIRQLDETLRTEQTEILEYVHAHGQLPEIINAYDQQIDFTPRAPEQKTPYYASEKVWNDRKHEDEWRRKLVFSVSAGGTTYRATVSKSQVETEDILTLVLLIGAGMIAIILLVGFLTNRWLIKRLWKPFYRTLQEVDNFKLARQAPVALPETGIYEFDILNKGLNRMTGKAAHDYQLLKEFSANAAHEMQTPLAVIRTNTETLMQDEDLLQRHNNSIDTIEQSVKRLSRMNQALLLLTRIENRQFAADEKIRVDELVERKLNELSELIESRTIRLQTDLSPVTIHGNRFLVEIIIQNLLNNAIRYNLAEGTIMVRLTEEALIVRNNSSLPALEKERLGQRFYRHPETKPDGSGLGLSIVRQVCELSGYEFQYHYEDTMHEFRIRFGGSQGN